MITLPRIETERLLLRPFELADAPDVQRLAGDRAVAAGTLTIPHPYPDGAAEAWIASHEGRDAAPFAIERRDDEALLGAVGLDVEPDHSRAELGYWIGKPYWGNGYATEAARAVVRYAFESLHLHRVYAHHFVGNPASGRVLQKIGMAYEGRRRQHTVKWGTRLDSESYAILRDDQ
jgi:[ribosomal protein S5]-alanine N-acetyltransferase